MGETNQRVAYGNTLKMLGKDDERIVVQEEIWVARLWGRYLRRHILNGTLKWE